MITIKVLRFDPEKDEKPYYKEYEIEKTEQMKVLDALTAINDKYNENISFRSSCRAGQCGSCSLKINGSGALACKSEINNGDIIEPLDLPIIKDLIVNREIYEDKAASMDLELNIPESNRLNLDLKPEELEDTKKVRTCIECYSCLSSCPVVKDFGDEYAGPYFMRYLSKFEFDPRNDNERLNQIIEEGVYDCTSCRKCEEVCPKNIKIYGKAIEKLRSIITNNDLGPLDAHKNINRMVRETNRSVSYPKEGLSFIEEVNKDKDPSKKSKYALFTGCMVDYRLQKVGHALLDVLKANDIDIDVPEGQVCCGSPLIRTGQTDLIQNLVDTNKEVFKDYDTVVTICAGCGATLKNDHPEYGSNLNVQDISEFLVDKLDVSKMKELDKTVTWHDPCHLARGQNIREEPRRILNMIPGLKFNEMDNPAKCCGAGGGVKSAKPEIAMTLAKDRVNEIKETDAEAVISICPFCQRNIQDALDEEGLENIHVINLIELLQEAYAE
ncbi:fumarate reductase (CoM/CoB) subunit TfrB [Methanobrevibacter boviskoreani]|uniref:fumarate reductase (CoM/CoB) subunit TfrB n=1 Tax=Methanobrevibacter boviskoreani TaxID=1348249 RepID=UPI0023A86796|nr:fumarate reductase (CoM/CoB) subunit TfrB [Methanobrevibacter boviskoreani]MCI6774588.1 succinate dehydrogenase/fumarate reductase iron-sulfur subunit [Methanobrevibacter boviskoreani]MDY5614105.1 fumarate reductase (CoM/CoB) subunit TfrB [Methanobrevibacter boviskoreani]